MSSLLQNISQKIYATRTTRHLALGLVFIHLLTAFMFWHQGFLKAFYPTNPMAICYSFFPGCHAIEFGASIAKVLLLLYFFAGLLSLVALLKKKWWNYGLILLVVISVFKLVLFLSRYNLMGNYHLMHFLMVFTLFAFPGKESSFKLVLVSFYIFAGMLKLNLEWLSGAALIRAPVLTGKWLALSLAYVVVFELILIWGVFVKSRTIQGLTLLQVLAFHIFSWHVVGYYYPMTMFGLWAPIFIGFLLPRDEKTQSPSPSALAWAFVIFLGVFNMAPYFSNEDPGLSGHLRGLRFNMLDARSTCHPVVYIENSSKKEIDFIEIGRFNALRTHCDPTGFESQLKDYCQSLKDGETLNFILYAKRAIDPNFTIIEKEFNFCAGNYVSNH